MPKIVEKHALIRFNTHCNVHSMLPQYQSAYCKFHSCETALTKLVNNCLWAMEDQKVTELVAMDLSAAFNTVDHGILLDVLNKQFGVRGTALKWFDSYLHPRDCKVYVNGSYPTPRPLNFSVPQESLAGLFLYLAYTASLQDVIPQDITLYGYANDHLASKKAKVSQLPGAIEDLEHCMTDVKSWMDENCLKMNSDKIEFLVVGLSRMVCKCKSDTITYHSKK